MQIFGFTLLRNGIKYDYPFRESLTTLSSLAQETWIALGKSIDETEAAIQALKSLTPVHVLPTIWDESLRKDGLILSHQTNLALEELRKHHATGWGFYLQSDEVLLESELEQMRHDLQRAEREGFDAVSFRYLHFWQRYDRIAVGRRWYPHEVRAIRLDTDIASYGDAQSFAGCKKIFHSDAHVFHYGHVRRPEAYDLKKRDFHRWWHSDQEIEGLVKKSCESDQTEETLAYLGPHPNAMTERLKNLPGAFGEKRELWIYGPKTVEAPHLHFTKDVAEIFKHPPESVVLSKSLPFFKHLTAPRYRTRIPAGMRSPQARPWTKEFRLRLLLAEKGVTL